MTVIPFAPKPLQQDGAWQVSELKAMQSTFAADVASGSASAWHIASTEAGDPQFYLMGPPPDEDCILAISRLGRLYVLEDGAGHIVYEGVNLDRLVARAKSFLHDSKASLAGRLVVFWAAVRQTFEERIEPILAEGEEFLLHIAPKLVA